MIKTQRNKNNHFKRDSKSKKGLKETMPYNVCDRFCERCRHQKNCRVFKDINVRQIKHVMEGRNPHDIKTVFNDVEETFLQLKSMIKKMASEEGIDLQQALSSKEYDRQFMAAERMVQKHALYKKARQFHGHTRIFLKKLFAGAQSKNPFLLSALDTEINDLMFYFHMIPPKIYRALFQFYDHSDRDNKYAEEDINRSACIALNASLVCEKAISNIIGEAEDIYIEGLQLATMLRNLRLDIQKTFPEAESFQKEIIFNTAID